MALRRTRVLGGAVRGFPSSLANKWQWSYRDSARVSSLSYQLTHCKTGDKCETIHINDLKNFFDRSEDLDSLQIPVTADRGSRPVTLSSPEFSVMKLMHFGGCYIVSIWGHGIYTSPEEDANGHSTIVLLFVR